MEGAKVKAKVKSKKAKQKKRVVDALPEAASVVREDIFLASEDWGLFFLDFCSFPLCGERPAHLTTVKVPGGVLCPCEFFTVTGYTPRGAVAGTVQEIEVSPH